MADKIAMANNWLDPFLKASKIGSQEELADALDLSRATINRLAADHSSLKRPRAEKMAPLLDVSVEDLMLNRPPKVTASLVSSFDPDDVHKDDDPDWDGNGAGVIDGRLSYTPKLPGGMPETAASPGMGLGRVDDDRAARLVTGGIATGHPVINEWVIPPSYVRNALDAAPSQVMIMPVIGHSMEPLLKTNDRVLVDISQNVWVGDAVYIIDDGDGVMQAKTIRKVMSSNPPSFEIISEATPEDKSVVRRHDQFRIVGRVVGRFTRM